MFAHAFDPDKALGVFLFSGATNSEADFEAYLAAVVALDERAMHLDRPVLVQVVDPENAIPDAKWRRRIAEATTTIRSKPFYVMVTESTAARGVLTALNWLRPPPFEFEVVSTIERAARMVEQKTGRELELVLYKLLDGLRQASRPTTGRPPTGPSSR